MISKIDSLNIAKIFATIAAISFASTVVSTVTLLGTHSILNAGLLGKLGPSASWYFFGSSLGTLALFAPLSVLTFCRSKRSSVSSPSKQEILSDPNLQTQKIEEVTSESKQFASVAEKLENALERVRSFILPNREGDFEIFKNQVLKLIQDVINLKQELSLPDITQFNPYWFATQKNDWCYFQQDPDSKNWELESNVSNLIISCSQLIDNCKSQIRSSLDSENERMLNELINKNQDLFDNDCLDTIDPKEKNKEEERSIEDHLYDARPFFNVTSDDEDLEEQKDKLRNFLEQIDKYCHSFNLENFFSPHRKCLDDFLLDSTMSQEDWNWNLQDVEELKNTLNEAVRKLQYDFIDAYAARVNVIQTPPAKQGVSLVKDDHWFHFTFHKFKDTLDYETRFGWFVGSMSTGSKPDQKNIQALVDQYKIHLMPKPEYVYDTFSKLLQFMKQNPALREIIDAVKLSRIAKPSPDALGRQAPVIVIYIKPGKKNAQYALNDLVKKFKPYFEWGSNVLPRFNCRGKNPLVFYAQGDAFSKIKIIDEKPTLFDKLYDEEGIHFNAQFGNFPLKLPSDF